jgi:hypothetical protein
VGNEACRCRHAALSERAYEVQTTSRRLCFRAEFEVGRAIANAVAAVDATLQVREGGIIYVMRSRDYRHYLQASNETAGTHGPASIERILHVRHQS